MHKLFTTYRLVLWLKIFLVIFILNSSFIILNSPISAQSPSPSPAGSGTLPQSGIAAPLFLLLGGGGALFGSGLFLKKLGHP